MGTSVHALADISLAWLLTYLLHSTLLLGIAWGLSHRLARSPAAREALWKTALLGGVVTASLHASLDVEPALGAWGVGPAPSSEIRSEPLGASSSSLASMPDGPTAAAAGDTPWTDTAGAGEAAPHPLYTMAPGAWQAGGPRTAREDRSVREALEAEGIQEVGVLRSGRGARSSAARSFPERGFASPRARSALVLLWVGGAFAFLMRVLLAHRRLLRALGPRRPVRARVLLDVLDELCRRARVRRSLRLTTSRACVSPAVLSRREICVPHRFLEELGEEEQRAALAHEVAHLARRDPAWHLGAVTLASVFFFQPMNWMALRGISEAAEELSDAWVARELKAGVRLARCLVHVAEWIEQGEPVPRVGLAMAQEGSALEGRVRRLVEGSAQAPLPRRGTRVLAALALVGLVALGAPSFRAEAAPMVGQGTAPSPHSPASDSVSGRMLPAFPSLGGEDAVAEQEARATESRDSAATAEHPGHFANPPRSEVEPRDPEPLRSGNEGERPGTVSEEPEEEGVPEWRVSAVPAQVLAGEDRTLDSEHLRISLGLDEDRIPVGSSPRLPTDLADGRVLSLVGGTRFGLEDAGQVIHSTLDLHWTMPDGSQGVLLSLRDGDRWGLKTARWLEFPYLPMAAVPSSAGGGDPFYLGEGRRPEVWVIEADTDSVRTIRWEADLPEITEEHRALYLEHLVATAPHADAEARHRTFLEQTPLPERMPAYGALRTDEGGNLWVEEYRPPWDREGRATRWLVFAPSGERIASATVPPGLRLVRIGEDFAVARNDGPESSSAQIGIHPLVKPER